MTDEFGEPVANASVTAWRYAYMAGARRLMPAGQNARDTTDDQGHYRLFGLPPGDYYVSASLRPFGPEATDPSGDLPGYANTYYPGTSNAGEAGRVTLAVAQENTGINFGLIATNTTLDRSAVQGLAHAELAARGGRRGLERVAHLTDQRDDEQDEENEIEQEAPEGVDPGPHFGDPAAHDAENRSGHESLRWISRTA